MTTDIQPTARMGTLVTTYFVTLVLGTGIFLATLWALARYTDQAYPVGVMFFILPMVAAMQAGTSYFRQAGRVPAFGYVLNFGVITTLLLLAAVVAMAQLGLLDGIMVQIDPSIAQTGNIGRALTPLLIVIGAIGLFCNSLMFWASARGQWKQQERKARKAAGKQG